MTDEPNDKDPKKQPPMDQLEQLSAGSGQLSTKEQYKKTSHIGLLMAYDLIDKLRFWEKETLSLPDEEIAERLEHLITAVEQLRVAYLDFADLDS